tara:strand:- start:476 stop:808 length:333 start_codon:yes stop_codon:yes gene_type:complete
MNFSTSSRRTLISLELHRTAFRAPLEIQRRMVLVVTPNILATSPSANMLSAPLFQKIDDQNTDQTAHRPLLNLRSRLEALIEFLGQVGCGYYLGIWLWFLGFQSELLLCL